MYTAADVRTAVESRTAELPTDVLLLLKWVYTAVMLDGTGCYGATR